MGLFALFGEVNFIMQWEEGRRVKGLGLGARCRKRMEVMGFGCFMRFVILSIGLCRSKREWLVAVGVRSMGVLLFEDSNEHGELVDFHELFSFQF